MCVILNQCLAGCQACNIYRERRGEARGERAKEGRSVNLAPGMWHWWTEAVGEDWEGREKEECNLFRWRRRQGGGNVSEAGGVFRKVQVSGWKGDRGMPGCVTVAILSPACVDTVSCISLRNKPFLLAQCRASSSPPYSSPPLRDPGSRSLPPVHIPVLIFDLNVFSVSPPCLCLHYHLFPLSTIALDSPHIFFFLLFLFLRQLNSVILYLHKGEATITRRATIRHSVEDRPLPGPICRGHRFYSQERGDKRREEWQQVSTKTAGVDQLIITKQ